MQAVKETNVSTDFNEISHTGFPTENLRRVHLWKKLRKSFQNGGFLIVYQQWPNILNGLVLTTNHTERKLEKIHKFNT